MKTYLEFNVKTSLDKVIEQLTKLRDQLDQTKKWETWWDAYTYPDDTAYEICVQLYEKDN